jgi:hypothetical protein
MPPTIGETLRVWLLSALVVHGAVAGNPDAKRLYDDLLSNYNKLVRPVVNTSDVLRVCIKLKLSQLIDVVSTPPYLRGPRPFRFLIVRAKVAELFFYIPLDILETRRHSVLLAFLIYATLHPVLFLPFQVNIHPPLRPSPPHPHPANYPTPRPSHLPFNFKLSLNLLNSLNEMFKVFPQF